MTANDIFIKTAIEITDDRALVAAAAQLHTTAFWLSSADVAIVDWARYEDAMATVNNG